MIMLEVLIWAILTIMVSILVAGAGFMLLSSPRKHPESDALLDAYDHEQQRKARR